MAYWAEIFSGWRWKLLEQWEPSGGHLRQLLRNVSKSIKSRFYQLHLNEIRDHKNIIYIIYLIRCSYIYIRVSLEARLSIILKYNKYNTG